MEKLKKQTKRVAVQGVFEDVLPVRLTIRLRNRPDLGAKLRGFALRKKAVNYSQAIELLINEAEYYERRLKELKNETFK